MSSGSFQEVQKPVDWYRLIQFLSVPQNDQLTKVLAEFHE
jgi:hypothetical protein